MDSMDGSKCVDANSPIFGKIEYVLFGYKDSGICAVHYFS